MRSLWPGTLALRAAGSSALAACDVALPQEWRDVESITMADGLTQRNSVTQARFARWLFVEARVQFNLANIYLQAWPA